MTQWTDARKDQLTMLWETSTMTAAEIGKKMGGFESTRDGGRSAVLGMVHRMQLAARSSRRCDDPAELARRADRQRKKHAEATRLRRHAARGLDTSVPTSSEENKPEVIEPYAGSLNITFDDLRNFSHTDTNQCRYPVDEFFCGVETPDGKSWCVHHRVIVFYAPPQITDAHRQRRAAHARGIGHRNSTAIRCSDVDALTSSI